jgi:arylsulfatase A-like enzyme
VSTRLRSLAATWARAKGDLALVSLLEVPLLLLSVLPARTLAASHAYPSAPPAALLGLLLRSLPFDLVALGGLAVLVLLSRRLRTPDRLRGLALVLIYAAFSFLGALYYLAAGAFMRFGGPPSRELLLMVAPLVEYSPKVVSLDDPLVRLAALGVAWPAVLIPTLWSAGRRLVRSPREWAWPAWMLPTVLALAGVVAATLPMDSYRERDLRRVSPLNLLRSRARAARGQPAELTAEHGRVLERLLGGKRTEARAALSPLAPRRRSIVVWVWESVGERFLRSHHPLGAARSPQLDRLEARGSVRFSNVHVECPLSAQSTYTLMTGASPPANPRVYHSALPVVRRAPYLPALLKAAGYHTAFLNSSYLRIWGEDRFLREAGLDVVEDAESLENRSRYRYQDWSIEGRAIVDRFFDWRDALPAGDPFYAVIWNVETHFRYHWIGMPREYEKDDELTRYLRAIEYTDRLLGTFFEGLVARNLDHDTLIVVVGDHGQGLGRGSRPYDRFESLLVSEDDTHVPLAILHGDLPGPKVVDVPTTLADLYPTLLDLTGLGVPEGIDGASLVQEYQPRVTVSRAITWWPLAARAGPFKLVLDYPDEPPELYEIASDPWETRDVSGRHEHVTRALWAYLEAETARRRRADPSFALFSAKDWLKY